MSFRKAATIGALVFLCFVCSCSTTLVSEGKSKDLFKAHSVWQGACDQTGSEPYPMIIFIQSRNGDSFAGMTWYPTLNNGLITITGQVSPKGIVTFTEDKVIYGAPAEGRGGVISGGQYTATIKGENLKGGYVITLPNGESDKGNIILKLAD
jgi:hypothetical protein